MLSPFVGFAEYLFCLAIYSLGAMQSMKKEKLRAFT